MVGCVIKANRPFVGPGLAGGMGRVFPWGVFLKDPRPRVRLFRRKPRETPNG